MKSNYYIVFHPAAFDLMDLSEERPDTPAALLSYITGLDARALRPDNYLNYLYPDMSKKRPEILNYFGMDNYASSYIANQIAKIDAKAPILLADNERRRIPDIIKAMKTAPQAVFMSCISSSFPTAAAMTLPLNHARIPVIIGGIHVSTSFDDMDTYIRNHMPHPRLIAGVRGSGDTSVIRQIVTDLRNHNLKSHYTGTRPVENGAWGHANVRPLPPMPLRFFNKLPIIGRHLDKRFRINVTTPYLGCPYACRFCSISTMPRNQRTFSSRDPEDFIDELKFLQKNQGPPHRFFFFLPDNLLLGRKKLETILDKMIAADLRLNYAAQISVDVAENATLLKKLRESGASHFFIGLESLDMRNLEHIGKNAVKAIRKSGLSVKQYYSRAIRKIIDAGISIHGAFITGLPYDYYHSPNDHTGIEIADFCIRNHIGVQPASLTALPGSIDFKELRENEGLLYGNPGSMDYLLSLCLMDLSEMNQRVPDTLRGSPLVVAFMVYDMVRRVGSVKNAVRTAAYMAWKAWLRPTRAGRINRTERAWDSFAAALFQLGASAYKELGEALVTSRKGIRGTFERLYEQETDPAVRHLFASWMHRYR